MCYGTKQSQISPWLNWHPLPHSQASLLAQMIKISPAGWETWILFLGWEGLLEKGTATHSNILSWRIPWTVQSMESQRVMQICVCLYKCSQCLYTIADRGALSEQLSFMVWLSCLGWLWLICLNLRASLPPEQEMT